jgi:hypothetical protein
MASGGTISIQSLVNIGTVIQAILRFCLSNLKYCNVGITDGNDFLCTPLKLAQVACQAPGRSVQAFK